MGVILKSRTPPQPLPTSGRGLTRRTAEAQYARPAAARLLPPCGGDGRQARGGLRSRNRNLATLIPVLVTGIQQPRVCAVTGPLQPKDLGWLDSCDKHRNEGNLEVTGGNPVQSAIGHTGAAYRSPPLRGRCPAGQRGVTSRHPLRKILTYRRQPPLSPSVTSPPQGGRSTGDCRAVVILHSTAQQRSPSP
jgi:hypothetical protein